MSRVPFSVILNESSDPLDQQLLRYLALVDAVARCVDTPRFARVARMRLFARADLLTAVEARFGFDDEESGEWLCDQVRRWRDR